MLVMENAEEIMQILERFTKLKQKDIPKELEEYLSYVAKTGDTVYTWAHIKYLFREKLMHVIKDFHDSTSSVDDLPQYPNVDPFNYETMKSALLERLELFNSAPFTVQRLCELLTDPKKQYCRIDKYMRALEKNILVVSTIEPGRKQTESENGDSLDSVVNGDLSLDVNIDVEIDISNEAFFSMQHPIRTNATSSTTTITNNINNIDDNKMLDDQQDDVEMPFTKKQKLELEEVTQSTSNTNIKVSTITTNITTSDHVVVDPTIIPPSSVIPQQSQPCSSSATSSLLTSEQQQESITTDDSVDIEKSKEDENNKQPETTAANINENIIENIEENKEEKIISNVNNQIIEEQLLNEENATKLNENESINEENLIDGSNTIPKIEETINSGTLKLVEAVKIILAENKAETERLDELHKRIIQTTTEEETENILNIEDNTENEKNIIIETTEKKLPVECDEVIKDADELIKDDIAATLKESADADEKFEKEIENIEADDLPVDILDNNKIAEEAAAAAKDEEAAAKYEAAAAKDEEAAAKYEAAAKDEAAAAKDEESEKICIEKDNIVESIITAAVELTKDEEELAEIYPHSVVVDDIPPEQTKISEQMSVEDITLTLINPIPSIPTQMITSSADTTTIEPIITDNIIFSSIESDEKIPEAAVPLDVDIIITESISDTITPDYPTDQPMEESNSNTDTAMLGDDPSSNDRDLLSLGGDSNEVIMLPAESEMATDSELPNNKNHDDDKAELAGSTGMDVDDTSQEEAMDQ